LFTSILTLAMGLGMLAGGALTDWMCTRLRHRHAFAVVPVIGLTCSAFLLVPGFLSESPMITLVCFGLAMAAAGTRAGAFGPLAASQTSAVPRREPPESPTAHENTHTHASYLRSILRMLINLVMCRAAHWLMDSAGPSLETWPCQCRS